jgi:nitrogen fixation NifU-like protein
MVVEGDAAQADGLGKLAVLKGVAEFPTRVKCASLAWHALHSALHGDQKPATTE